MIENAAKNRHQGRALCLLALSGLTLFFIFVAAANLHNYFPISADDAWIMSASTKLANEGVFGSDLYAGFYNADRRYFIALPVHHFLQALSFTLFGTGVAQARLPNLLAAALLIWITAILAWRHGGWRAGLLAAILLLFWRSNLVATEPRPPLLAFAHSGRYDVTATAFVWLTVLLLDTHLRQPRHFLAVSVGLCAGAAALTQFFGAFMLPLVAILWLWQWGRGALRRPDTWLAIAGFLTVVLPYVVYVLVAPGDFTGQAALKGARVQFDRISFYLHNLWREGNRYAWLAQEQWRALRAMEHQPRLFGPWFLMLGLPFVVLHLFRRARAATTPVAHMPWLALLIFLDGLALFDQTKAPVYSVVLLPGLSLAFALAAAAAISAAGRWQQQLAHDRWLRLLPPALTMLVLLVVLAEGFRGYLRQREVALNASPYLAVAQRIEAALPPQASILAAERWWPALYDYPYLALNNVWTQWRVENENGYAVAFSSLVADSGSNVVIVNNNVRGDITGYPQPLQRQFWGFLASCGALSASWQDATYGHIEVFHLLPDCAGKEVDRP